MELPGGLFIAILFFTAFGAVLCGIPVAFALGGAGLLVAFLAGALGGFDIVLLGAIPSRIFGAAMFNEVLTAVPLFILMGVILERGRVAENLLEAMAGLFGSVRGGLGLSVTFVGALLAASTGIVGATVVAMGLISLPTMIRRGYDPAFASGSICVAGTLGQIIPPSIVLVFLADQLSGAHMEAQREIGNSSPDPLSVSGLFAGALIPGAGLACLYMIYQGLVAWRRPGACPAIPPDGPEARPPATRLIATLVAPAGMIIAVPGSILAGIATPTEAAGIGALCALLLSGYQLSGGENQVAAGAGTLRRLVLAGGGGAILLPVIGIFADLRVTRDAIPAADRIGIALAAAATAMLAAGVLASLLALGRNRLAQPVLQGATRISALAFAILIGATIFSLVFRGLGGDELAAAALGNMPGGVIGALIAVNIVVFALGFFLDFIEIIFIVIPIVAPVVLQSDIDPVWFGVLIAMNLQTSFVTPPFGFALFYLRGAAPAQVRTADIYRGVLPFIAIQVLALLMLALFPGLATWLPGVLFG